MRSRKTRNDDGETFVNAELALLAKVVDTGEIREVLDAGIKVTSFSDPYYRGVFQWIFDYYRNRQTSGEVPTRAQLRAQFANITLPPADRSSLSAAIKEFRDTNIRSSLVLLSDRFADCKDVDKALRDTSRIIRDLMAQTRSTRDIVVSNAAEDCRQRYVDRKNPNLLTGIPYPWEVLTNETLGINRGEYIVFYGRPKSMKTWVGLSICCNAYKHANSRVLIYSREMIPENMMDRCICLLTGAPYDAFKKGRLHEYPHPEGGTVEDAFHDVLDTMFKDEKTCALETGQHKSIIITSDRDDKDGGGITGLQSKIEEYSPDLVFVDAIYLMRDDSAGKRSVKWEHQANISHELSDLASGSGVPFIVTTQANRDAEEKKGKAVSNISHTDAVGQDCTMAIEIIKKRIDDYHNELALCITASREINMTGFAIHGCAASNFSMMYRPLIIDGVKQAGENGEPEKLVPYVFSDYGDIQDMFNEQQQSQRRKMSPNFRPSDEGRGPSIDLRKSFASARRNARESP